MAEAVISGRAALSGIVMSVLKAVMSIFLSVVTGNIFSRISIIIVAYAVIVQVLIAVSILPVPGTGSAGISRDNGGGGRTSLDSSAACAASCTGSSACGKYGCCAQYHNGCPDDESFHKFLHKKHLPEY